MSPGFWQIAIVVLLILLFFGRGKISAFLKELGKGASSFKAGVEEGKEENKKAAASKKKPAAKSSKKK